MDQYPEYGPNQLQERKGVSRFASEIADLDLIWRETPNSDVGIDGQIEFVDANGFATGLVVAVQVKSGETYIRGDEDALIYYPSSKHANYWREFPVPVLLAIHDPATRTIFWTDARQQLRSSLTVDGPIRVPRSQTVASSQPSDFFATLRPIEQPMPEKEVVRALLQHVHPNPGFRMSFFELFGFGITDIGRKLFFSMSLCMEIAEYRAHEAGTGWTVGSDEHQFVDRYISFLVSQGLIYYDYSDYLIDRDEVGLAPNFLVPLTKRGRMTLEIMQVATNNLFHEALLGVQENSVHSILTRLAAVERIQQALRASGFDNLPEL